MLVHVCILFLPITKFVALVVCTVPVIRQPDCTHVAKQCSATICQILSPEVVRIAHITDDSPHY